MKRVTFYTQNKSASKVVHVMRTKEMTWCNLSVYDNGRTFEGNRITRASDTNKAPTCGKCRGRLIVEMSANLRKFSLPDLERIYEYIGYESRTPARSR